MNGVATCPRCNKVKGQRIDFFPTEKGYELLCVRCKNHVWRSGILLMSAGIDVGVVYVIFSILMFQIGWPTNTYLSNSGVLIANICLGLVFIALFVLWSYLVWRKKPPKQFPT